jgi:peptide/nickel transport system ATP-binding protein
LNHQQVSELDDDELARIRNKEIGFVFQTFNLLARATALHNVELPLIYAGVPAHERSERAREALTSVGMGERMMHKPNELSGGQRQRVAIAMAVVMSPGLLIADEPTTALDVIAQAQILLLLQQLVRTRNMGLILVSHDLAVVAQLADRVAVMSQGEIIEQATADEILRRPCHAYTAALLSAARLQPKPAAPLSMSARTSPPANTASMPAVLDVQGIVREYPRKRTSLWRPAPPLRAVDGVSLSVHAGETVGLVGESGSGKSSLLKAILALETSQAGEVSLLGESMLSAKGATMRRLRRAIQAVFQDPYGSFDPQWTVERLIGEPFHLLASVPSAAARRRKVAVVLEQVGLSASDAQRLPREFSGGERQRIAIARALVTEPKVIAFDEAVSALDVLIRGQVLNLLAELAQRLKLSYLFVSHDLQVMRAMADRIYVMQRGRIVEEGPTETVFASPRHAYTQALIAATPKLPVT